MAIYEVEAAGKTFEVEAPNIKRAESAARLYVARSRMTEGATAGAQARSSAPVANDGFGPESTGNVFTDSALAGMSGEGGSFADPNATAGDVANRAALQASVLGAGAGAGAGVVPLLRGAALSMVGGAAGGFAGRGIGTGLEAAGLPAGTSNVLGAVGGAVGSIGGPIKGPAFIARMVGAGGGRGGAVVQFLERLLPAAEQKAATVAAKGLSGPEAAKAIEVKLAQLAEKRAAREAAQKLAERRIAVAEERNQLLRQRLEGKAPPAPRPAPAAPPAPSPDATMPATPSASASPPRPAPVAASVPEPPSAAELQNIVLKIQQTATSPAERKVIQAWLKEQPKEVASQIRLMLARRQAHPATVYTKPSGEDASADLARMLGQ